MDFRGKWQKVNELKKIYISTVFKNRIQITNFL